MIVLHHLNKSRSKRIIWLLEDLGVEYRIQAYQRDAVTSLAPDELKQIHPLGKSPVIEYEGKVIAESGAMTEFLIDKYAADRLMPTKGTLEYAEYLQWIHFAESSAMLPLLLNLFLSKDGCETNFLGDYAQSEMVKVMGYFDQAVSGKSYLVGGRLSGADFMMSFVAEGLNNSGVISMFPNIEAYLQGLLELPAYRKACDIEAELDTAVQ